MANYSGNEVVEVLLVLGECHRNYRAAARLYAERFPNQRHPNDRQIRNIERRCRMNDLHRQRGRNRNVNNNDPRLLAVLAMVHMNPHISTREIERRLGVPRTTAHRMLRSAGYHPYHIILHQELNENDYILRMNYCRWALNRLDEDPNFFWNVCFSDEATFKSDGRLNRHNCHYWSPVNPHWHRQVINQHRWSLNVWVGIFNGHIIGPYFFDGNVNGQAYLDFLENHLPEYLEDIPLNVRQLMWLQQDGAPAHFAVNVREFLNAQFLDHWIGRGGPVPWPPRSPDLNPLDSYFWGYCKDAVYKDAPTTRLDMMERVRRACAAVTPEILTNVLNNYRRRSETCLANNGGPIEHLM